uniref:AlNc14C4G574 protein n=1 Tax=Albugo laibachii Nc14 TaxID=890382 RepID=F0W0D1_9STRA|nr:AlNc14C4G574 [Albugo laibachii Nc14]|eukprot:CCA14503.1 AlNc14C4G574 [Albugo laibachii Nc14]
MSEEEKIKQKNVIIEYTSNCVWANYKSKESGCNQCITALGEVTKSHIAISLSASLTLFESTYEKKKLASCMTSAVWREYKKCLQLVFVPDFMCEHEFVDQSSIVQERQ